MTTAPRDARAAVLTAYRTQLEAMKSGDTDALGACLTEGFTLTHMSGYVQSRAEWLTEMAAGDFVYHSVEPQGEPHIDIAGDSATLTHRLITDATVYGSRHRWRLATVHTFVRRNHTWQAAESVATTW